MWYKGKEDDMSREYAEKILKNFHNAVAVCVYYKSTQLGTNLGYLDREFVVFGNFEAYRHYKNSGIGPSYRNYPVYFTREQL
jgi:hypothetical protein